jgi:hypothetical protein
MRLKIFYGLLRMHVEQDGRLLPLSYSVGDSATFDQATVVNGEYTIAVCRILASSIEEARESFRADLHWLQPLIGSATPDAWFTPGNPE